MRKFKTILPSLTSTLVISGLFLSLNACTGQSPMQTDNVKVSDEALAKGVTTPGGKNGNDEDQNQGGNDGQPAYDDLLEQKSRWGIASE